MCLQVAEETVDISRIPIISDEDGFIHRQFGLVRPGTKNAVKNLIQATIALVVSPDLTIQFVSQYPFAVGQNYPEMMRSLDSMTIHHFHPRIGTWANWQPGGEDCLILPDETGQVLSKDECNELFPKGNFACLHDWFRITPVPDTPGVNMDVEEEEEVEDPDAKGRGALGF